MRSIIDITPNGNLQQGLQHESSWIFWHFRLLSQITEQNVTRKKQEAASSNHFSSRADWMVSDRSAISLCFVCMSLYCRRNE